MKNDDEAKREEASMPSEVADAWAEVYIDVAEGTWDDSERDAVIDVGEKTEPDPALDGSTERPAITGWRSATC